MKIRHRVGFVGAGHISEFHAAALRRISGVELVGIYDIDARRAEDAARRLATPTVGSLEAFGERGVDVIHVLTPPETHADVALRALELGTHVLVEKPLATDVDDCRRIAAAAQARNLRVCVDHSLLYDIQVRRALEAVRSGAIGRVVSVDILRSADYPPYEGGPLPPQYRSAGYPFRDLGIHQLYLLAAFLGPIEDVRGDWRSLGGDPNLTFDEWHASVRCRDGLAHFHISFNVRPIQNIITVQGTKGVLRVEPMSMFSTRRTATPLPKTAERVINAYAESLQAMIEVPQSVAGFIRKKIRQYHGVQELVGEFYRTLDENLPVPVGVDDAIPIVDWTERIARAADADAASRAKLMPQLSSQVRILVTGAAGALGSAVVARLQADRRRFRVFVRRNALDFPDGVEVATGDLGDPLAVDRAVRGARIVIHIGAATKGGWVSQRTSTVVGTQNVIDACLKHGIEQLVYISSLSVINWSGERDGAPIGESSPFERMPQSRGAYTRAKLEAELLVRAAVETKGLPAVILRPGQIFGGKLPLVNAAVARKVGRHHMVLGDGTLRLPLVYIEDVVDAIFAAMERRLTGGETVQLVDTNLPTQNEILRRALDSRAKIIRIPRPVVFVLGGISEIALGMLKRQSPLSRYRLRSALARRTYVSEAAVRLLDWTPRIGVDAGINASIDGKPVGSAHVTYAANPT
ncbi:MAG: NAD-dependent epimerase/dehydratase family protein [Vulcanimicrobiaceae bacterium]